MQSFFKFACAVLPETSSHENDVLEDCLCRRWESGGFFPCDYSERSEIFDSSVLESSFCLIVENCDVWVLVKTKVGKRVYAIPEKHLT